MNAQSAKPKAAAKEPVPKPGRWHTRSEFCFLHDIRVSVHYGRGAFAFEWTVEDDACLVVDKGHADTQAAARRAALAAAKKLFRDRYAKPSAETAGDPQ